MHTTATIQRLLFQPSFILSSLSLLILTVLTPSTAFAQECTGAVQVGAQFRLASSVGAGPNGVAGAKLTLTVTNQANFVAGTEQSSRGTWSVQARRAVLDIGNMAPNETVTWGIDLRALSAGTATFTQTFSSSAGGSAQSTCTISISSPSPGSIRGTKWHDLDRNGRQNGDEPGLAGWRIYVDENDNGQRDGGEPSATTGSNGSYQIGGLDPDTYTVREELQDGWEQTFPSDGAHTVTVESGSTVSGVDFGNYEDVPMADLGVQVNASDNSAGGDTLGVSVGDTLDVEVKVDNSGPDDAEGITITLRIDADGNVLVIDPESPDQCGGRGTPSMPDGQTVKWDLDQVDDGESVPCKVKIFTVERGEAKINGTVTSTTTDPNPDNNDDDLFATVEQVKRADLAVDKRVEPDTVFVGEMVTYTVSVLNRGPDDAVNARIKDIVFSDSLEFVQASLPAGCTLSQNNGQIDCALGTLAAGQTVSISYKALTKLVGGVTNLVDATSDLEDPDVENNIKSARLTVRGGADVSVEKTVAVVGFPNAPVDTVTIGTVLAYTVKVTNNGPETAFLVETDDLVFSDSLEYVPESVQENCDLGSATDDDTGKPLATMMCRHAAILEPGESEMSTYHAVVKETGVISNEVEVTSAPRDLNPENNIAVVKTVVVGTTIDFTIDASASVNSANVGDEVKFNFSCTAKQPAERCQVTGTANSAWASPTLQGTFVIADGDTMAVAEGDSMIVEVDPEGFPAGTTRITYTFNGGYTEGGETYMGTFTLKADKANPAASVSFEASTPGNDDPNTDDDIIEILVNIDALATAIEEDEVGVPEAFRLHSNYPNPFNPETTIRFDVKERARVRLQVFNVLGQVVATLVDEERATGTYRAVFEARGLPSGSYFYRLEAGAFSETRLMVLLK